VQEVRQIWLNVPMVDLLRFLGTPEMVDLIKDIATDPKVVKSKKLFSVPTGFEIGLETKTLNEVLHALKLTVSLVWREKGLALAIAGDTEQLIYFSDIT
jgi:hypothetical protein